MGKMISIRVKDENIKHVRKRKGIDGGCAGRGACAYRIFSGIVCTSKRGAGSQFVLLNLHFKHKIANQFSEGS